MERRDIAKALMGSVAAGAMLSRPAHAQAAPNTFPPAPVEGSYAPIDSAYPPGDIRRYGATSGQNCDLAIAKSLEFWRVATVPENFVALLSKPINVNASGQQILGKSRYTSILQPTNSFTVPQNVAAAMITFYGQAAGTYYGLAVHDLCIRLYGPNNVKKDLIGVDLASINNSTVRRVRFEGQDRTGAGDVDAGYGNLVASGVRFAAPVDGGAYSNCVHDCDFSDLEHGVIVGNGGNHNIVRGGEFFYCAYGVHAIPSSTDTLFLDGPRFERCNIGVYEGISKSVYLRCRFEAQFTTDIQFHADSRHAMVIGCSTADTVTPVTGLAAINQACMFSPAMTGIRLYGSMGFNGATPIAKPTVSGSRANNAALASLLSALASYGLITNSTN